MKKILAVHLEEEFTQIGVYFNEEAIIFDQIRHFPEELLVFKNNVEQLEFRKEIIHKLLRKYNISLHEFSGICAFGGRLSEREGGIYRINSFLLEDAKKYLEEDISSLLPLLLYSLEEEYQLETYIVEHKLVDELPALARYSGSSAYLRHPYFDALRVRTAAMMWEEENGRDFFSSRQIVVNIERDRVETVAFLKGRVLDVYSSLGDGAFSLRYPGRIPYYVVRENPDFSFSKDEMGLSSYFEGKALSLQDLEKFLDSSDEKERYSVEAFIYNVSKDAAALAVNFKEGMDAIVIVGLYPFKGLQEKFQEILSSYGRLHFTPNFSPLKAVAYRFYQYLQGKEECKEYV